jgi:hypothetical protein
LFSAMVNAQIGFHEPRAVPMRDNESIVIRVLVRSGVDLRQSALGFSDQEVHAFGLLDKVVLLEIFRICRWAIGIEAVLRITGIQLRTNPGFAILIQRCAVVGDGWI